MSTPAAVKNYLASIGRKGGLAGGTSKSEPKAAAARANGAKGGRPRKVNPKPLTDGVVELKFGDRLRINGSVVTVLDEGVFARQTCSCPFLSCLF